VPALDPASKEVAAELGCSSDTVRRGIRTGKIRAATLPGLGEKNEYFRISESEVVRLKKPKK
jgi:excisionase family DNA binding protein